MFSNTSGNYRLTCRLFLILLKHTLITFNIFEVWGCFADSGPEHYRLNHNCCVVVRCVLNEIWDVRCSWRTSSCCDIFPWDTERQGQTCIMAGVPGDSYVLSVIFLLSPWLHKVTVTGPFFLLFSELRIMRFVSSSTVYWHDDLVLRDWHKWIYTQKYWNPIFSLHHIFY